MIIKSEQTKDFIGQFTTVLSFIQHINDGLVKAYIFYEKWWIIIMNNVVTYTSIYLF